MQRGMGQQGGGDGGISCGPVLRRRRLLAALVGAGLTISAAPVLAACSAATAPAPAASPVVQRTASTSAATSQQTTSPVATTGIAAPSAKPVATNGPKIRISEWDIPPEPFGVWLNGYLQAFPAKTGIQLEILLKNPGIPVDQEQDTWVASGDVPDVFYRNSRGAAIFAAYAVKKVIQPLSPYIARDQFDLADFWPDAITVLSGQGKLWVMPQDFNVSIWAYNVPDFQGAGVALPPTSWSDTAWSWDTFLRTAQQLQQYLTHQNAAGGHYAMGRFGVTGNWEEWVWSNGGEVVSADGKTFLLDQPAALEALDFAAKLMTDYHVAPAPGDKLAAGDAAALGNSLVAVDLLHASGVSNQVRAVNPTLDFDVTMIAHGAGGAIAGGGGDGYALSATSRAPDAAWELLKYLGAPEYAKNKVSFGGLGPRSSAAHQYFVQEGKPPAHAALYFDATAHARWEPNLINWPDVSKAINQALAPVWLGKQTATEAVAGAKQAVQSLLQQGEVFT